MFFSYQTFTRTCVPIVLWRFSNTCVCLVFSCAETFFHVLWQNLIAFLLYPFFTKLATFSHRLPYAKLCFERRDYSTYSAYISQIRTLLRGCLLWASSYITYRTMHRTTIRSLTYPLCFISTLESVLISFIFLATFQFLHSFLLCLQRCIRTEIK